MKICYVTSSSSVVCKNKSKPFISVLSYFMPNWTSFLRSNWKEKDSFEQIRNFCLHDKCLVLLFDLGCLFSPKAVVLKRQRSLSFISHPFFALDERSWAERRSSTYKLFMSTVILPSINHAVHVRSPLISWDNCHTFNSKSTINVIYWVAYSRFLIPSW